MPVSTRQQMQSHAWSTNMPRQRPTQNSSLLTDLPLELGDMIYDQVFADDSEIVIPHPLMQTSKQLREEVTQTAARKIGSRGKLNLAPRFYSRDHEVYASITMDDSAWTYHPRSPRLYTNKRSLPWPEADLFWRDFCYSEFGKQLIPHICHITIFTSMMNPKEIIIRFNKNSAPKITLIKNPYYENDNLAAQAYQKCLLIAKKYQEQKAVCSVEWVDAFMRDIVDACSILVHGVRR